MNASRRNGCTFWRRGAMIIAALSVCCTSPAQNVVVKKMETCEVRTVSLKGCGGEENWSSATVMPSGRLLVGMSSRCGNAVLLEINPDTGTFRRVVGLAQVGRLGVTQRQPKIHVNPVRDAEGCYHFLSHFGLESHVPFHGSRTGYEGMRRWRWNPKTGQAEDLGVLIAGEGAIALNASSDGKRLFVVTFPQALLLEVHTQTGALRNYGRTNGCYAPRHILVDPWDNPYILDHSGRFWSVLDPQKGLLPLDTRLSAVPHVSGNLLSQGFVACQPLGDRSEWLAMSAWGQLYRIRFTKPGEVRVSSYGCPTDRIEALDWGPLGSRFVTAAGLAAAPDGWVYIGVSGYNRATDKSGDSYLVRFNPKRCISELVARFSGAHISYICGNGLVDRKKGRIFFVGNHLVQDSPHLIVLEGIRG